MSESEAIERIDNETIVKVLCAVRAHCWDHRDFGDEDEDDTGEGNCPSCVFHRVRGYCPFMEHDETSMQLWKGPWEWDTGVLAEEYFLSKDK